ncbi:MAG: hypothetical protein EZS28_032187 [Streblomastix strix]|uniref:Uncharacterized protein n=1 Tax=Streblomastix strix TaxID=222440 RepID=A0A5J4UNI4_9EUKA|nr:MAG: hypothetical protein EZS28_032187 [Streblomastix strix]
MTTKFEIIENESGRKMAIEVGIANTLLDIYEQRSLDQITRAYSYSQGFYILASHSSNDMKQYLLKLRPFQGLVKLLEHKNIDVIGDSISAILNILQIKSRSQSLKDSQQHFQILNEFGGVEKIFEILKNKLNKCITD